MVWVRGGWNEVGRSKGWMMEMMEGTIERWQDHGKEILHHFLKRNLWNEPATYPDASSLTLSTHGVGRTGYCTHYKQVKDWVKQRGKLSLCWKGKEKGKTFSCKEDMDSCFQWSAARWIGWELLKSQSKVCAVHTRWQVSEWLTTSSPQLSRDWQSKSRPASGRLDRTSPCLSEICAAAGSTWQTCPVPLHTLQFVCQK